MQNNPPMGLTRDERAAWLDDRTRERFMSRCDRSGGPDACWPWLSTANVIGEKRETVNRVAWRLAHGRPRAGLIVVRRCQTPGCANVRHMALGTRRDRVLPKPAAWRPHADRILRLAALNVASSIAAATIGLRPRDVTACLRYLAARAKAPSVAAFLRRERRRAL